MAEFPLSVEECAAAGYSMAVMGLLNLSEELLKAATTDTEKAIVKGVRVLVKQLTASPPEPKEYQAHIMRIVRAHEDKKLHNQIKATVQ